MRRFLLIFAILSLAPIIGHAATCTSTETVTKCAKIPTEIYGYEYKNGQYTSDSWSLEYNDVVLSGNSASTSGFHATCTINSPFNASIDGSLGPEALDFYTAYQACANVGLWEMKTFSFTSKLDGDICPDGFYTVPYNVSCGAGMVDTANVPNCSDDTSGESCLIPATSAPAPEYKFTATIDLSLYKDNQMDTGSPVTEFGFDLGAAGTFYVDWGDGTTETINKDNTDVVTYTHDYGTTSGTYTVKIGGLATDYSDDEFAFGSAISFEVGIGDSSVPSRAITEISGSLGAIFPTLPDGSQPSFAYTFYSAYNLTGFLPPKLFEGIYGTPASHMYNSTFAGCSGLTGEIPKNFFGELSGDRYYNSVFYGTFLGCSGLTGPIPAGLFGTPKILGSETFTSTFEGCSGLTSIPDNLFGEIESFAGATFEGTFLNCSGLTGPSARINGEYLYNIWPHRPIEDVRNMYSGATGLDDYADIPVTWGGIKPLDYPPAPDDAEYKFFLTTAPDTEMFSFNLGASGEFYVDWGDGTTQLISRDYPDLESYEHMYAVPGTYTIKLGGLATGYNSDSTISFIDISGYISEIDGSLGAIFPTLPDGSQPSFRGTFVGAMLTNIPSGLFDGIYGEIRENMFSWTFAYTGITSIPDNLFAGLNTTSEYGPAGAFAGTFENCFNLTGPSARINGMPLYELWPDNVADWGVDMYTDATGLDDYACIPTVMGGGGEECAPAPEYKFSLTISSSFDKESWGFGISAAGTFYVDWGDGNTEKIEKTDTQYEAYIHDYTFDSRHQSYTIRIGGMATAYSDNDSAIDYSYEAGRLITEINGSLGAVFPTLPDGSQPNFGNCFRSAKITEIPAELFNGIYGAPTEGMFQNTFYSNSNLVSIPENLFSGITGNAPNMFAGTFSASGITSIPENLFAGITGAAEDMFYYTFSASNITSIPENLFSGITGAAAGMFESTFSFCPSLTSIPENLFSGVTGAADRMFSNTFGHSGITSIPENLFSGITGNAPYMFVDTFLSSGITSIPENLFSGITGAAEGMFRSTFANCSNLTGPSARINGKYLYDLWPDNVAEWGLDMYAYATGLDDYACIPTVMGGGGESCEPTPEVLCTIGISQIKISTGMSFALYAEKYTQPSLAIKYNDGICYGKLEQGNQSGTMNFNYNGTVYHLAN